MTCRPVVATDEPLLRRVFASTRGAELAVPGWTDAQRAALCDAQYDAQDRGYRTQFPDASFEVVLEDDEPAGRVCVDRSGAQIQLVDIGLLPERRGRGLGGRLLAELLREAESTCRQVLLHVERTNPARRLYERLGFVEMETGPVYVRMVWRPTS